MRRTLSLGLFAGLVACSGGGATVVQQPTKPVPPLAGNDPKLDLPGIPAKIAVTTSAPTEGNAPDKRSPILDTLKTENEREMAALKKTPDPAYYLGYQLVEQRIVSLEAEGGALVDDKDDIARNLDVEVRVGSPQLDNTRQISDDSNGLNAPLTRRGLVPFGDDKTALANALWLETDRRYHESVSALGYVKQDQSTLSKHKSDADFSTEPAEVYVEAPAKLEFDKAQWVDRLKRCSAKALKGQATRSNT